MDFSSVKIKYSARRTVAVTVTADGEVILRAPYGFSLKKAHAFLQEKAVWIEKTLNKVNAGARLPKFTQEEVLRLKKATKAQVSSILEKYAKPRVDYDKVCVRAQKTVWGSCSSKKNLNFNCLLCLLPESVVEYVVVHEVSHLKVMNHSPMFWKEVERLLPDYKTRRKQLKSMGADLISRLP